MDWQDELKQILDKKNITQRQFCNRTGVYQSEFNNIINKKRPLSMKVALMLEFLFIKTAKYWLTKQLEEDIKIAKREDGRF